MFLQMQYLKEIFVVRGTPCERVTNVVFWTELSANKSRNDFFR